MNLWLIVPVKPFGEGKSRLAKTLTLTERAELNRNLLTHTLSVAQTTNVRLRTLVVSRSLDVLALARFYDAQTVVEDGNDLNSALDQGRQEALRQGADAILVLPVDLPLLLPEDIFHLSHMGQHRANVVIAPSHDGGTSALLLHPPHAMPFAFGINSFQQHRRLAQAAGIPCHVHHAPRLQYDIDWPQDLRWLRAQSVAA